MTTTTIKNPEHNKLTALDFAIWAALGAFLFAVVPYVGTETYKTVANWMLVFHDGSPFSTSSHYYHPGDRMDVFAQRYANFHATVESARLLRKINPGTVVEDVVEKINASFIPIEEGPHGVEFHPTLPAKLAPGKYHYIFVGKYTMYDRNNNFVWETVEFEVLPPEVPIGEPKAAATRATMRLNQ